METETDTESKLTSPGLHTFRSEYCDDEWCCLTRRFRDPHLTEGLQSLPPGKVADQDCPVGQWDALPPAMRWSFLVYAGYNNQFYNSEFP